MGSTLNRFLDEVRGAAVFALSDSVLATNRFVKPFAHAHVEFARINTTPTAARSLVSQRLRFASAAIGVPP